MNVRILYLCHGSEPTSRGKSPLLAIILIVILPTVIMDSTSQVPPCQKLTPSSLPRHPEGSKVKLTINGGISHNKLHKIFLSECMFIYVLQICMYNFTMRLLLAMKWYSDVEITYESLSFSKTVLFHNTVLWV